MFGILEEEAGRASLKGSKSVTSIGREQPGERAKAARAREARSLLRWRSHLFEDLIFYLYLAPNETLRKALIYEWNENRDALREPRARSPEPPSSPVPGTHPGSLILL